MSDRTQLRASHPAFRALLWTLGLAIGALVAIGVGSMLLEVASGLLGALAGIGGAA